MYFGYALLCLLLLQTCESELSSLIVIHRHADRTPVVTYPYDLYECTWTTGGGSLVEEGVERMRKFGKILRYTYGNFWPPKSDLAIQSSRVDRVIKSLQSLLEGIYSDNYLANPTAFLARKNNEDHILYPITTNCPNYVAELERVFNLSENVEWFNNLKPLWSRLARYSGEKIEKLDVNNRLQIINLQDVFIVQIHHDLKLPHWMSHVLYDKLANAAIKQMRIIYSTPKLQRFAAGLLFKELRNQMNAVKNRNFKKVHIYSTHDVKLAAVLMGLTAFNDILPPYGASIIFELHSNPLSNEKHFIKGFYLNDTSSAMHALKLYDCDETVGCSFEKFEKLIENLIPDNWEEECMAGEK